MRIAAAVGGAGALVAPNKVEEPAYREHIAGKDLPDEALIRVLARYPDLMRKPILFNGDKAVLGFDPEQFQEAVGG